MLRRFGLAILLLVLGLGSVRAEEEPATVRFSMRLLTVSSTTFDRLKEDFRLDEKKPMLASEQTLRTLFETVQADRQTNILAAPRVATVLGQSATVQIGEQQTLTTGARVAIRNGLVQVEPEQSTVETGLKLVLDPKAPGGNGDAGSVVDLSLLLTSTRLGKVERIPLKIEKQTTTIDRAQLVKNQVETRLNLPLGRTAVMTGWWEDGKAGKEAQRVIVCITAE